jgi:hypothetical protein
MTIFLQGN